MDASMSCSVPSYSLPLRASSTAFSVSALLAFMPPMLVSLMRPFDLIWATMPPRVSQWDSSSSAFASSLPPKSTISPPFTPRQCSQPRAVNSVSSQEIARSVQPLGLGIASSAQVFSTAKSVSF